ncbi:MAG TPA: hypothetical protein VM617_08630 [Thermoanaerobaculia bacterium]|nr:hypothetical protein [Thermoanaerobaculia bacterium]
METRRASTYLGCGCAVVIAILLGAVLTVTWTTYRAGKEMARIARDPEASAQRAREVVEFGELPAGYRAYGALSMPFLLDVAFFLAPVEGGGGAEDEGVIAPEEPLRVDRGFLYVRLRDWMGRGGELEAALGGDAADAAPISQEGLDFSPREVVARGELVSGEASVTWLARRGKVSIDPDAFAGGRGRVVVDGEDLVEVDYAGDGDGRVGRGGRVPAVLTLLHFDCPGGGWQRLGVWFAPDPAPDRPVSEVDWSGGPGDPEAIADLLGRFGLCG